MPSPAPIKKNGKRLTPYQEQIDKCFGDMLDDVTKLNDNKALYTKISGIYPLQASETTYREVFYKIGEQKRKLKLEDEKVKISRIESDDSLTEIAKDTLETDSKSNGMRYKVKSREARLNQLLSGAVITSDYIKTIEYRSRQLVLNLVWSDSSIKTLNVQFEGGSKTLECERKDVADICSCRQ